MRFALVIVALGLALATACGSYGSGTKPPAPTGGGTTGGVAGGGDVEPVMEEGTSWGGWRYQGARGDCFFVVERKCFTNLADACGAAACKGGCTTSGAGPTIVTCR